MHEYDGVWHNRIHARVAGHAGGDERWWSVTEQATVEQAAADVIEQLRSGALDELRQFTQPGHLLSLARAGNVTHMRADPRVPIAVLLAAEGASPELSTTLAELETVDDPLRRAYFDQVAGWCRAEAEARNDRR